MMKSLSGCSFTRSHAHVVIVGACENMVTMNEQSGSVAMKCFCAYSGFNAPTVERHMLSCWIFSFHTPEFPGRLPADYYCRHNGKKLCSRTGNQPIYRGWHGFAHQDSIQETLAAETALREHFAAGRSHHGLFPFFWPSVHAD